MAIMAGRLLNPRLWVAGSSPPVIAGPITNDESENMAAKIASAIAGARQVPNLRRTRSRNGIEATKPIAANRAVPPAPASSAAPASGPT